MKLGKRWLETVFNDMNNPTEQAAVEYIARLEAENKALKEEIARLERRYRIDEDVAEYRKSIGMHERE